MLRSSSSRRRFILLAALLAGSLASQLPATDRPPLQFEFRKVADSAKDNTEQPAWYDKETQEELLHVYKEALLTHAEVKEAHPTISNDNPAISVIFTESGAKTLAKVTRDNKRQKIAIVLNGMVLVAPTIVDEITGGEVVITGSFTELEAKDIAKLLNPAPTAKK